MTQSLDAMDVDVATRTAAVLKSLADPLRLRMLSLIAATPGGEACVCDIATVADVSQPTVSHHLKVLKDSGVLTSQRRGTWVYYRLAPDLVAPVLGLLGGFAPAVARPARAAEALRRTPGAADDDLARTASALVAQVPGTTLDAALRTVRESYTALSRTAGPGADVVAHAEAFARQRLRDALRGTAERAADGEAAAPHVLFVCVSNAGRSQLAAALAQHYAGDAVAVRSAGSLPAAHVHAEVEALLTEMGATDAFPKPLTDDALRAADMVVTLGCGDACPVLPGVRYEDWVVGDPALASRAGVRAIAAEIDDHVRALLVEMLPGVDLPSSPVRAAP